MASVVDEERVGVEDQMLCMWWELWLILSYRRAGAPCLSGVQRTCYQCNFKANRANRFKFNRLHVF